jgi:hypothetical protein
VSWGPYHSYKASWDTTKGNLYMGAKRCTYPGVDLSFYQPDFRVVTSFSDRNWSHIGLLKSDSAWNWSRFLSGGKDAVAVRDRIKNVCAVSPSPRRGLGETAIKVSTKLKSAAASLPPQPSRIPGAFHQHRPILTDGDQTFKAERC